MNENSKAIFVLCSHIGAKKQNVKPLEPKEWSILATKLREVSTEPKDLLTLDLKLFETLDLKEDLVIRIKALVNRTSTLIFEMQKYENLGIHYLTRADKNYPHILKEKLKNSCPPLIYYCGNLNLLKKKYVGFVGSRDVKEKDIKIDHILVAKTLDLYDGVVSGGAKGIDMESSNFSLNNGGYCLEILSNAMLKKLKDKDYMNFIRENKLLCLSIASPDASFDVGMAMMRNKFIYLFSKGTIVITTSFNKGGTWAGAIECIKKGYAPINVVNNNNEGNKELIKLKAKPINENWDGTFDAIIPIQEKKEKKEKNKELENNKQLSLF